MSIATELEAYKTFLGNAYNKCQEKNATMPTNKNLQNLEACIDSIKGGGSFSFGTTVKVQATDNFSVGDTFVGTTVSGTAPTTARVSSGISSTVGHISADGSVALRSTAIRSSSTSVTLYIKSGDTFVSVSVPLPDMTGATSVTPSNTNKYTSINEDGTIIVINMTAFLLKIDVDKKNLTATAYRIEPGSVDLSKYPYDDGYGVRETTGIQFNSNVKICGSYLFFNLTARYVGGSSGTTVNSTKYFMYGRVLSGTITNEYLLHEGTVTLNYASGVNHYNGNDLVFVCGYNGRVLRLEISSGDVVSVNNGDTGLSGITQNGEYGVNSSNKNFYKINRETGTCSLLKTIGNATSYIDETGQYYAYSNGCYRISDDVKIGTAYNPAGSSYFKIVNDSYVDTSRYITTLVPSESAEYTIAHTQSILEAGAIYGVVTEAMTLGEIKDAQKLFDANV